MRSIGLDIGSFSVKVAEVEIKGKNAVLKQLMEYPLSADLQADHALEIVEILRKVAATFDPRVCRYVIGLPQSDTTLRTKLFPLKERNKIAKVLAFQLEDEVPIDVREAIIDARILEYVGNSSVVLTVTAQAETVEKRLRQVTEVGIDPDVVTVDSLSLGNCFEPWTQSPRTVTSPTLVVADSDEPRQGAITVSPAQGIVCLGHRRSSLLVYRNGSLATARSFLFGGHTIALALSAAFSRPYSESLKSLMSEEALLLNSLGASAQQKQHSDTVASAFSVFTRELRFTLIQLKTEMGLDVGSIQLTGGLARMPNLPAYLTRTLETTVNSSSINPSGLVLASGLSDSEQVRSGTAIGLALEGLRRMNNPAINFRRDRFVKKNSSEQRALQKWIQIGQLAVALFVILFVYGILRDTFASSLNDEMQAQLETQGKKLAGDRKMSGIKRFVDRKKKQQKKVEAISRLNGYVSALTLVNRLSEELPQRQTIGGSELSFDISLLKIENESFEIRGQAFGDGAGAAIQKSLQSFVKSGTLKPVAGLPPNEFGYEGQLVRVQ